jgi:sialate O-acetylesterase
VKLSPEVVQTTFSAEKQEIVLTLDQPVISVDVCDMELSDDGRQFRNTSARAEGNRVVVSTAGFRSPSVLRYAWKDNPIQANIRSLGGLPMSSFELKIVKSAP